MSEMFDSIKNEATREAIRKLMDGPKKKWKHEVVDQDQVLEYSLSYSIESKSAHIVRRLLSNYLVSDPTALNGTYFVAVSGTNVRVEGQGRTINGLNFIYITDKSSGFLYLDKSTETYLHFEKQKVVSFSKSEVIKATVELTPTTNENLVKATVLYSTTEKYKYELLLDVSQQWKPFREKVICLAMGCKDNQVQAGIDFGSLVSTGIPIEGVLYAETQPGQFSKVSSFKIDSLSVQSNRSGLFDVPKSYKNARQIKKDDKLMKRNLRQSPKIRLSDFIKNKNDFYPDYSRFSSVETSFPVSPPNYAAIYQSPESKWPSCFGEDYLTRIGNIVDQKLLDEIRYFVNIASNRLEQFTGADGNLKIDWIQQLKNTTPSDDEAEGSGLYPLLHDEKATDAGYPLKKGLLDRLAISALNRLMKNGDALNSLGLPAALQTAVNNIINDATIDPKDRFSKLSIANQGLLVDAYVFNGIGTIGLEYPTTFDPESVFYDLVNIQVTDVDFDLFLERQPVLDKFSVDGNCIDLILKFPYVSGSAWVLRFPTERYLWVTGISVVLCLLVPFTCFLMEMSILVALFLILDIAYAELEIEDITMDIKLTMVPNLAGILQPKVDMTLDASVSIFYLSVIPDGLAQLISYVITLVYSNTSTLLDKIRTKASEKLQKFVKDHLDITYPPSFDPVTFSGISNTILYAENDNMYVEQSVVAGSPSIINPYITAVDKDIKVSSFTLRDEFKTKFTDPGELWGSLTSLDPDPNNSRNILTWVGAQSNVDVGRYYMSTILSQNLINTYLYAQWRHGVFNYDFGPLQTGLLFIKFQEVFSDFAGIVFNSDTMHAHIWPAVPPRLLFTAKPSSEGGFYSTTIFDDVRICFEMPSLSNAPQKLELSFAAQADSELGFGGINRQSGKLDLLKLNDRLFDLYFDLNSARLRSILPELRYHVIPGMEPKTDNDYTALGNPLLDEMLSEAMMYWLENRDCKVIPRSSSDSRFIQRYPLGDDAIQVVMKLVPFRGNLYISKGIGGIASAVLKGGLDISRINKEIATNILTVIDNV